MAIAGFASPGSARLEASGMQEHLFRRVWWRTLRCLGFSKYSWDKQYEAGVWSHGTRSPQTLKLVAALCGGGKLVEFGCGDGNLAFLLTEGGYSLYLGYDLSQVAIDRARRRLVGKGMDNVVFEQRDMATWEGTDNASLILAEECLYYLSHGDVERFLARCSGSLTAEGTILIIVWNADKHGDTLDVCRRSCRVVEEVRLGSRVYLTLAPRRRS